MVLLSLEHCLIRVASALPIIYVQFLYFPLLFLKLFESNRFAIREVAAIEMLTRFHKRSWVRQLHVVWLPHFLDV